MLAESLHSCSSYLVPPALLQLTSDTGRWQDRRQEGHKTSKKASWGSPQL